MKILDKVEQEDPDISDIDALITFKQDRFDKMHGRQDSVTIDMSKSFKWLAIMVLGDLHLGSDWTNHSAIRNAVTTAINTKDTLVIQVGDIQNAESSSASRYRVRAAPEEVSLNIQRRVARSIWKSLKDKLIGFVIGNHDRRCIVAEDYDIGTDLVTSINGVYLGYGGLITIRCNSGIEYRIFVMHDYRGSSKTNPHHKAMAKWMTDRSIDVVCFGHTHSTGCHQTIPTRRGNVVFIRAGGYCTGRSDYVRSHDFEETEISTPMFLLSPTTRKILPFDYMEDAIEHLKMKNTRGALPCDKHAEM